MVNVGAEYLRSTLREIELIVQSEAYHLGLAAEGEWGVIPADLHVADKLSKYILRTYQHRLDEKGFKEPFGWWVEPPDGEPYLARSLDDPGLDAGYKSTALFAIRPK